MANEKAVPSSVKIAVVTGGSRGLGRSTVIGLARRGVHSIFTYHANRAEADKVVDAVAELGAKAVALQLDARDVKSFDAFARQVRSALAGLGAERFDYLVNNAGTGLHKPIADTTEEEFDQLMNVHLRGVFFLTQKLLPLIADGGRIINVSSGLARFSMPGTAAYAMMKGGIEVFTRSLAKELGARRITANTVAPGAIETDFNGGRTRDNADLNRIIAQSTALGRAGVPDDVGPMIAALLADDNRWVNGQRIEVSGGMFL
jgi:NAD(P)-dependent dehydrogenase (short-subunit alcohol dehydrogenase family)